MQKSEVLPRSGRPWCPMQLTENRDSRNTFATFLQRLEPIIYKPPRKSHSCMPTSSGGGLPNWMITPYVLPYNPCYKIYL